MANNFFLAERTKIPQPPCKSFSYQLERSFHFSQCGNAIFAFKVSLLRFIFSRTFAAGFTLVQTVLHCVFAGVQLETIWFKIENVSEE